MRPFGTAPMERSRWILALGPSFWAGCFAAPFFQSGAWPWALAAAGAWLLFSALFSVYVNHFAKGLALYGSLTTMVLTMLWVYVCVSIVFYGAFFNRLLAQRRENRT